MFVYIIQQVNFHANDLNIHWRWWDWIQTIFLNLFYFNFFLWKWTCFKIGDWSRFQNVHNAVCWKKGKKENYFLLFSWILLYHNNFSNLNYNCSNLLDQTTSWKCILLPKIVLTFHSQWSQKFCKLPAFSLEFQKVFLEH